jgi:uncharacterized lipoprotein YddW (UPF0748 family)
MKFLSLPAVIALALLVVGCAGDGPGAVDPPTVPPPAAADTALPPLQREARGMWIATVANIDWPSRSGLPAEQQRGELREILDLAAAAGVNMVVLQVRPAGDAVYASALEPWARLLTGTQGGDPGYDPLAFAIVEAHARGMELHAWVNPFRAGNTSDTLLLAASHIARAQPDLVRVYGSQLWMDPGEPATQDHTMRVILDIIARYDIDGIHADDYFYPYPQYDAGGRLLPFPDAASYARHGGVLALDDWRRANIDRFVERLYREVRALRPALKVGISPFGIWRPGHPPGVQGLDAYATIYADSRKWLQQGWVDYLAPQLYWSISAPQQSYPALLDWWLAQNTAGRHVWPGLAAYRVNNGTSSAFTMQEIPDQIRLTRTRSGGTGHLLYNASWTLRRHGGALASTLAADLYRHGAVPPALPWLDDRVPAPPLLEVTGTTLRVAPQGGDSPRWWVVRTRSPAGWRSRLVAGTSEAIFIDTSIDRVLVHAASRTLVVGPATEWQRQQ